jgi:transposase
MIHLGIDHHKKYSHVVAMNDSGAICWDGQLDSTREAFRLLKESLPADEPVQCVLEAGRNWGILYDALEELEMNPKLANPLKMRLIAETFTKTDKIDATTQAVILKAGLTPLVHVPSKEVRDQKNLLRQRVWLVKLQTMLKNRIHNILDRNHLVQPERTDVFGSHGKAWMNALDLRDPDGKLLKADLELLNALRTRIRETEKWIDEALKENSYIPILMTFPGIGKTLAALIALEINTIERFPSPAKLCSYGGLANSTYSSGGKTFHGGLVPTCNHHLRYAFIEAAWTAVRVSPYFQAFHKRLKNRKGAQDAIGAVGRKICEITWHCLKKNKNYEEKPYQFKPHRPVTVLACIGTRSQSVKS